MLQCEWADADVVLLVSTCFPWCASKSACVCEQRLGERYTAPRLLVRGMSPVAGYLLPPSGRTTRIPRAALRHYGAVANPRPAIHHIVWNPYWT